MKLGHKNELPDPKTFIKPVELPFASHKGVKIQARSFNVYNASLPKRDEIRKENYTRRLDQMSSQGFKTPINVPYRVLGDPLYLDHKRIILYGLGQHDELEKENQKTHEIVKPPLNLNSLTEVKDQANETSEKKFNIKNLNRSKQMYKLKDEVDKSKKLIRRVKLGQSYFDIIKQEEELKRKQLEKEKNSMTSSMQIRPMIESDDEFLESDDDCYLEMSRINDNSSPTANSVFNQPSLNTPFNSEYQPVDRKSTVHYYEREKTDMSTTEPFIYSNNARPQTFPSNHVSMSLPSGFKRAKTSTNRKSRDLPKPYTPVYSSLLAKEDPTLSADKSSITRQLCILLWILDSISVEPPMFVGPLRTCFMIKDLGGEKSKENYTKQAKKVEFNWKKFRQQKIDLEKSNENSKAKSTRHHKPPQAPHVLPRQNSNLITHENDTLQSHDMTADNTIDNELEFVKETFTGKRVSETPSSGIFDSMHEEEFGKDSRQQNRRNMLGESIVSINNLLNESINEDIGPNLNQAIENMSRQMSNIEYSSNQNSELALNQANHIFGMAGSSSSNTPSKNGKRMLGGGQSNAVSAVVNKNEPMKREQTSKSLKSSTASVSKSFVLPEHELEMLRIGDSEEMDRIFNKHTIKRDRRNSKSLKADTGPVHALWTEKVIEFQQNLPSVKKASKVKELKERFDSVYDESSIEISKRLEELLKKRVKTCTIKYLNMDLSQRGIHKMLEKMNESVIEHQKSEDMKNSPEPKYYKWYSDLEGLVVSFYSRDDCVLGKLLDKLSVYGKLNSKKQNEASFLKVLESLRIWELLSPDVMAAVEFCRERILEIQVDDFESWFQSKHPNFFISRNPNNKNLLQIENTVSSNTKSAHR